jgi:hypothetical protein
MITMRCKDDPEANGRTPQVGEQQFTLTFPLENGEDLKLFMGREGMNHFMGMISQMVYDDAEEAAR